MSVAKIGAAHAPRVAAVLEELLAQARAGELISLAFLAETTGREPIAGIVGRYREEPTRALGEMAIMKAKLARYAASQRDGFIVQVR
jgi:hypothetical protein